MIGLADALGCPRGDAAGQESHDVQLLPDLEVVTDGDGDLGVVVHRWAPCWRSPRNMNEASARRLDIRAGGPELAGGDAVARLEAPDKVTLVDEIGRASCRERVCQYV